VSVHGGSPVSFETMWAELAPVGRVASGGYRRQPFTSAEREARAWFEDQCRRRDLRLEEDGFGNVVAWWDAAGGDAVLTGSHLDSVVEGGAYDGPLGVVTALAAVDALRERGVAPSRPLGIAVFSEEEGSRFPVACLGSRLATGAMTWEQGRELKDRDGAAYGDLVPGPGAGADLLAHVGVFVELHVEQGRDLVHRDAPVGVASQIWPHGRFRFSFAGQANHAGTTAMGDRRDPMLTYAATALAAQHAAAASDQRATFGRVQVEPNGTNAVPSAVTAWLDARTDTSEALDELVAEVSRRAAERAEQDGTTVAVATESSTPAVTFDADLSDRLSRGRGWPVIPTAAGHDAGVLSEAGIPTAMLFVRNPTGVSHAPDEHAEAADCLAGVDVLADVLEDLLTEGATA
jgi:beta-ureidopropionase / N-carbamoyl-L-amino-acid hydrolase